MAEKSKSVLQKHPEVRNNAADYFTFEKTPIIEESVNRGDARISPVTQYDITDEDIKKIAKVAVNLVNKDLLESDRTAAIDSAVAEAIHTVDASQWQHKVNTSTFILIADQTEKLLTAAKEDKIMSKTTQNEKVQDMSTNTPSEKTAATVTKGPDNSVIRMDGKNKAVSISESGKASRLPAGKVRDLVMGMSPAQRRKIQQGEKEASEVLAELDRIASALQGVGSESLASEIDKVSNTIESFIKTASEKQADAERF
jgi:hypothetical protein